MGGKLWRFVRLVRLVRIEACELWRLVLLKGEKREPQVQGRRRQPRWQMKLKQMAGEIVREYGADYAWVGRKQEGSAGEILAEKMMSVMMLNGDGQKKAQLDPRR